MVGFALTARGHERWRWKAPKAINTPVKADVRKNEFPKIAIGRLVSYCKTTSQGRLYFPEKFDSKR